MKPTTTMTPRQLLECYREFASDLSPRTLSRMKHDVNRWEQIVKDNPPAKAIDTEHFVAFRNVQAERLLSPATIEGAVDTIRTLLNLLVKWGELEHAPFVGRRLQRIAKPQHVPTLDDLETVYLCADLANWPKRSIIPASTIFRAFIVVSYVSALRLSDVLAMEWRDVSEDGIRIDAKKTGKPAFCPMLPCVKAHLAELASHHRKVFPLPTALKSLRFELARMSKAAAVRPSLTPQMIRRLAVTEYERAVPGAGGIITGHAVKRVTRFYLDPSVAIAGAAEKLRIPKSFQSGAKIDREALAATPKRRKKTPPVPLPDPTLWEFRGGAFAFCGRWYEFRAEGLRVLRCIVQAGRPVGVRDVADAAFSDGCGDRDDALVQKMAVSSVCRLRARLAELFELPASYDPVPCVERVPSPLWTVHVPREAERGAA